MNKEVLVTIIEDLRAGNTPQLSILDFPQFDDAKGNPNLSQEVLNEIAESLSTEDIMVFTRALEALEQGETAWLGFKVVYNPEAAVQNTDNKVTKKYGDMGSADGEHMVFFCSEDKELRTPRPHSPRDAFQMEDVTRGPWMHNDQFEGLTWTSEPLFEQVRVWLLGATDVSSELSELAHHVGFDVVALDCDASFINEERFPHATRIVLPGGNFDGLDDYSAGPNDLVCVLTRGHVFDSESCIWGVKNKAAYVGMMGSKGKNNRIHDLVIQAGLTEQDWESIKRPIGLKFGAKTPAELAIAIVAELIDVRYRMQYDQSARDKHERSLGLQA